MMLLLAGTSFSEPYEAWSNAPSLVGLNVDGRPVPLASTAIHEPIALPKGLWARWKSLLQKHTVEQNEAVGINGSNVA